MGNAKKNKWFIAIKERGTPLFSTDSLRVIEPAEGTYHADPFLFRDLIFFELYDYEKGVIACMNKDGSNIKIVLQAPWHLSFPFIFDDEGKVYMIPETGAKDIWLYECLHFPTVWTPVALLVEGNFGDTVMIKRDGYYILFSTDGDNNLRLYRSKNLKGPYELFFAESFMHSRSAGKIFEQDGRLIRPVQNGEAYGKSILFKEIEFPYKEKLLNGHIEPDWFPNLTGTHTFNFDDTHIVIDGRIKL